MVLVFHLRHDNHHVPHQRVHHLLRQWILNTKHNMVMIANDHLHQILGTENRMITVEEDRTRLLKDGVKVVVVLELAGQHETLIHEI
jgi:hypothetical protein